MEGLLAPVDPTNTLFIAGGSVMVFGSCLFLLCRAEANDNENNAAGTPNNPPKVLQMGTSSLILVDRALQVLHALHSDPSKAFDSAVEFLNRVFASGVIPALVDNPILPGGTPAHIDSLANATVSALCTAMGALAAGGAPPPGFGNAPKRVEACASALVIILRAASSAAILQVGNDHLQLLLQALPLAPAAVAETLYYVPSSHSEWKQTLEVCSAHLQRMAAACGSPSTDSTVAPLWDLVQHIISTHLVSDPTATEVWYLLAPYMNPVHVQVQVQVQAPAPADAPAPALALAPTQAFGAGAPAGAGAGAGAGEQQGQPSSLLGPFIQDASDSLTGFDGSLAGFLYGEDLPAGSWYDDCEPRPCASPDQTAHPIHHADGEEEKKEEEEEEEEEEAEPDVDYDVPFCEKVFGTHGGAPAGAIEC